MSDMLSVGTFGWWTTASGGVVPSDEDIFTSILNMTCTIQRDSNTDEDGEPSWSNLATGVSCLLEPHTMKTSDQSQVTDIAKTVVGKLNLMLPKDQDITLRDRISSILRKSDGAVIDAGPLYIAAVHHVEDPDSGDEHHVEVGLKRENKKSGG